MLRVDTTDGRNFVLVEPFSYEAKDGTGYIVPAGSSSDGASTPPILWEKFDMEWIPPFGWYWIAAFFHDWAYRYSGLSKSLSDSLLLEIMDWIIQVDRQSGQISEIQKIERELKAKAIYDGVAIGGQSSFDSDRKT